MHPEDLISFTDAADELGCSRSTLYRAAKDGRLNEVEISGRRMLIRDDAWEDFEPLCRGRRVQKIEKGETDD